MLQISNNCSVIIHRCMSCDTVINWLRHWAGWYLMLGGRPRPLDDVIITGPLVVVVDAAVTVVVEVLVAASVLIAVLVVVLVVVELTRVTRPPRPRPDVWPRPRPRPLPRPLNGLSVSSSESDIRDLFFCQSTVTLHTVNCQSRYCDHAHCHAHLQHVLTCTVERVVTDWSE